MDSRSMRITSSLLAVLAFIAATGAAAAQKSEVTIGFVNPTTGVFGNLGKYARKGIDLALDQAQKNPGDNTHSCKIQASALRYQAKRSIALWAARAAIDYFLIFHSKTRPRFLRHPSTKRRWVRPR